MFTFQGKGQGDSIVKIDVYRNDRLDTLARIKAIVIEGMDTTINLVFADRYVKKVSLADLTHTLKIIIEKDTMLFSFLEIKEYISNKSPVSKWEIGIFDDMTLARKLYNYETKHVIVSTVKAKTKKLYVFGCDFCTVDTFNSIEPE